MNNGAGGPVNYATPIATVATLLWSTSAPGANQDITYVVRTLDTVTGLEDPSVDTRVRILTDAGGNDITNQPSPPTGLSLILRPTASARLHWWCPRVFPGGKPTGFHVYVGTPTPNYVTPVATVPYFDSFGSFSTVLTGLVDGTVYQAAVRTYNATAEEKNTIVVSFTADATPPAQVVGLSALAVTNPR